MMEDIPYIKAVEHASAQAGTGPLVPCRRTENASSTRSTCRESNSQLTLMSWIVYLTHFVILLHPIAYPHRNAEGKIETSPLHKVMCEAKVRVLVPIDRQACPFVLVLCRGIHHHHIPLPSTVPSSIEAYIKTTLLGNMREELSTMTPRRMMRDSKVLSHLRELFPELDSPGLGDLHPSLFNKDLLHRLIKDMKDITYPHGTDIKGDLFSLFMLPR